MMVSKSEVSPLLAIGRDPKFDKTRALVEELDQVITKAQIASPQKEDILFARDLSLSVHFYQSPRPDGQPYVNHPLEVALTVARKFGVINPDILIAALLHDSVEDQAERVIKYLGGEVVPSANIQQEALRLIGQRFGSRVATMVAYLSNPDYDQMAKSANLGGDTTPENELKNRFYKDHFLEIFDADPEAFLIKLSDFSENAFKIGNLDDGKRKDKLREKYGPVISALIDRVKKLDAPMHLLAKIKTDLVAELVEVYSRDYAALPN